MRLVRLNWVAKGQTITDESSGARASDVRELEAISHWRSVQKIRISIWCETLARNFIHTETRRSDTSLRIFLSFFPPPFFSFSLIYRKIELVLLLLSRGINILNLSSLYTSGSSGNAILSFFGIRSSRTEYRKSHKRKMKETIYKRKKNDGVPFL